MQGSMVRHRMAGRIERKLFRLNDEIAGLMEEERLVLEELTYHRHIADDAQRDAVVGGSDDRAFAREIEGDVPRFERVLRELRTRRARLEDRRADLLARLEDI